MFLLTAGSKGAVLDAICRDVLGNVIPPRFEPGAIGACVPNIAWFNALASDPAAAFVPGWLLPLAKLFNAPAVELGTAAAELK